MTNTTKILAASSLALGLFALAAPASAYIACNSEGDCWHTHDRVSVPGITFEYHPDSWYFRQDWKTGNRHWHDYQEGRGYWRSGAWIKL